VERSALDPKFTCFTGTKRLPALAAALDAQFTCFAGTKVQLLVQKAPRFARCLRYRDVAISRLVLDSSCMHIYINIERECAYVCMYVCMNVCVYVCACMYCIYVSLYLCIYVSMYVCVYIINIYIYTHTHTTCFIYI
jgi:hypothetical protein